MRVAVFFRKQHVANLRFAVCDKSWALTAKDLLVEPTSEVEAAIRTATRDVQTDVFQPNGRRIQLNDVEYVAER
jgi:hypothetical protein